MLRVSVAVIDILAECNPHFTPEVLANPTDPKSPGWAMVDHRFPVCVRHILAYILAHDILAKTRLG